MHALSNRHLHQSRRLAVPCRHGPLPTVLATVRHGPLSPRPLSPAPAHDREPDAGLVCHRVTSSEHLSVQSPVANDVTPRNLRLGKDNPVVISDALRDVVSECPIDLEAGFIKKLIGRTLVRKGGDLAMVKTQVLRFFTAIR